jgi:hypothetical protein
MASSATIHRESMSADSTAATALPADLSGLEGVIHSLLLRALVKIVDRMNGAALRSDDKSRRPLAIAEVDLSIESPVRSPAEPRETMLRVGSLELDLINRTAKRGDRPIDLLPSEFRLLKYMMQQSGKLLTRAKLFQDVWHGLRRRDLPRRCGPAVQCLLHHQIRRHGHGTFHLPFDRGGSRGATMGHRQRTPRCHVPIHAAGERRHCVLRLRP